MYLAILLTIFSTFSINLRSQCIICLCPPRNAGPDGKFDLLRDTNLPSEGSVHYERDILSFTSSVF